MTAAIVVVTPRRNCHYERALGLKIDRERYLRSWSPMCRGITNSREATHSDQTRIDMADLHHRPRAICALWRRLGFLVANERQANTQTDQAHATWHMTRRQIASALADLTNVRGQLRADGRTTTVVVSGLAQDTTQLTGVRAELQQAQSSMVAQGSTILDLQDCLGGVEQALNALSVGDLTQALSHLSAVATPCEKVPVGG